jgi:hypothetical protein
MDMIGFGRSRRLVDAILGIALALAVLAPLLLGPALVPLTRALGGADEHLCACGMAPGTCGCPECEKLEHARLAERAPRPYPVVKGQCGGDEVAPGYAALPAATPPSDGVLLAPSPRALLALERPATALSRDPTEPSTPPPRA